MNRTQDCKIDEEFNNFMIKVNEVAHIVEKLASNDKKLQEIGDLEAKRYLGEDKQQLAEELGTEEVILEVKSSKTLVNKKAFEECQKDQTTMSKEAFMDEISKDAKKRYKEKLIRTERMETFKKQATLAFKRKEFERALVLYTKAIEQIKDSPLLYNNRALTHMHLEFYDKAKEDINWALKLNENCLKSWLLLAKINLLQGNESEFEKSVREAISRNKSQENFVKNYVHELRNKIN